MVTKVTLQENSAGTIKLMRGNTYIAAFPAATCRDLAEAMAAELNKLGDGGDGRTKRIKEWYKLEKYKRGVRPGKQMDPNEALDQLPDLVVVEDSKEDKERRLGYTVGWETDEIENQLARLPFLIDQARAAEARVYRTQREYGAACAEARNQWNRVALALVAIGGQRLVEAIREVGE